MNSKNKVNKPKRAITKGFDGIGKEHTEKRLKNIRKNMTKDNWRRCDKIRVKYTYIKRTWTYLEKIFEDQTVSPFGH